MNTKKILIYTGGALALGAVTYFIWSFFQKVDIPVGNTTVTLGNDKKDTEEEKDTKEEKEPFVNPFTQYLDIKFDGIKLPETSIFADVNDFPLKSK